MPPRLVLPALALAGVMALHGCDSRPPEANLALRALRDSAGVTEAEAATRTSSDPSLADEDVPAPGPDLPEAPGVPIVENGSVQEMPIAFRIVPTPRLDLGGMKSDPEAELRAQATYLDVVQLEDGRYAVGNATGVTVFSPDGDYLTTIGKEGEGPGEFRQIRKLCTAPGDMIIAVDSRLRRFSVFDPSGTHVRTFAPTAMIEPEGCLSDGSLLLRGESRPNPASALPEDRATYLDRVATIRRISINGAQVGVVGELPVEVLHPAFSTGQGMVPYGDRIYAGNGFSPEYRVYGVDGTLLQIVRWAAPLIPATDEMLEQAFSVPPGSTASREGGLAGLRDLPLPDNLPVFSDLIVDTHGRVWAANANYHEGRRLPPLAWTVFDTSGKALGQVPVPEIPGAQSPEIVSVIEDEVLIGWRDDLGFRHVTFHGLRAMAPQ